MRAALEVIAERGYRGASLAAVAERVGLTQKYNAMRPAIVQTFSALLGESVTEEHPARAYFTERYAGVRAGMAGVLRAEYGDRLPSGLTPERAAPLLVAVLDGLQYQWLLDPESVDMASAFRDFLTLLGEGDD
ncbi:TetR family transcriptional regulator C-terminal domain-containing protein [Streptomyces collinus]|uniref:AcrR family transcriptional regulator n=1 Tax=Streptomyces collinus TaxID=42684 RepID=A0AA89PX46_STRCU|nr:AcrR family transcriptional regulator [Streptomyces collinus]